MAEIKIYSDRTKGAIFFDGSTVNPKFIGTCVATAFANGQEDRVTISRLDRVDPNTGGNRALFKRLLMSRIQNEGGEFLVADLGMNQSQVLQYLNSTFQDYGTTTTTTVVDDDVNFRLDDTNTTILLDSGSNFAVNSIKAVADSDGTIHLKPIEVGTPDTGSEVDVTFLSGMTPGKVFVNGTVVPGGLNDIANVLNELFTVGPFESVVISDPFATMVADVDGIDAGYTLEGADAVDPVGDDIFAYDGVGYANYAGLKSVATINQAGEYFTFDIRGEGPIGFGLVHTQGSYDDSKFSGNASYADPTKFAAVNSAHYGMQFSHWFHQTPNGSWTNYGASTGYVAGSGWSNWDQRDEWLADAPVKLKCGIDENGFISISSLQDDGTWVLHSRSSYPVIDGAEFHLGIKSQSANARVYSAPKVHLLEEEAPTMYFRYIESPDGNFEYPLFATEEEANYYHKILTGATTGTSHQHTYEDDPTGNTWYMPDNGQMAGVNAPYNMVFEGQTVLFTEITSLANADLTPAAFTGSDFTYEEGTSVNIQTMPAGATWTQSVDISPAGSGMIYNTGDGRVIGTLAEVGSDTEYTVTVTRANTYGSSVGSFKVTATDETPVQTNDTPWTKALDFSGSNEHAKQVSSDRSFNAMRMGGYGSSVSNNSDVDKTSSAGTAFPWMNSVVFRTDRNNSNQHIWNLGQGANNNDKNIYLRTDSSGNLYFGWGRGSNNSECLIAQGLSSSEYYGVYIAHKGGRFNYGGITSTNLADAFDIRLMGTNNNWTLSNNLSTPSNWTVNTNARMDLSMAFDFTIGGRGNNRSFHGKVASMVVSTLKRDTLVPDATEIEMIIKDPIKWVADYKVGNDYRHPAQTYNNPNFQVGDSQPAQSTQVWLMGDGSSDSYANGMRNYLQPSEQNNTKLQLNSMVSNDIQNVNIPGLS